MRFFKELATAQMGDNQEVRLDTAGQWIYDIQFSVAMAVGSHLFPSRTEKLSPPALMVLHG